MKKLKNFLLYTTGILLLSSCDLYDLDNYAEPNATIHGGFYDLQTGELIEQEIVQGTQIEYVEEGFSNPQIQYMIVKNDGTYRNNLMFAGRYTIQPVRGNFVPVPKQGVEVKGDTKIDFRVQPYIRIKDVKIEKLNNKVVATFKLEQTVGNKVSRIALFAHREPNVANSLNTVSAIMNINTMTYPDTEFMLEIDLAEQAAKLKSGEEYFFRVGALIDAPEAKFNYAKAVRLPIQLAE